MTTYHANICRFIFQSAFYCLRIKVMIPCCAKIICSLWDRAREDCLLIIGTLYEYVTKFTALNNKAIDLNNYVKNDNKRLYNTFSEVIGELKEDTKPTIFLFNLNAIRDRVNDDIIDYSISLHLDTQTTGESHIEAELQRYLTTRLVVGRCTHMLSHSAGGEEHRGTPLDEEALLGIGVVTHPELLEIGHQTIVHTATTTCTALDDEFGILLAYALQCTDEASVIVHIEVALAVGGEVA